MEAYRQTLNRANREFNKTKKLNELIVDYIYPLKAVKSVNTKYGLRKVVTLEESVTTGAPDRTLIVVFLPPRFNDTIFDMSYTHSLLYHGKKQMFNGDYFHDIEFGVLGLNNEQSCLNMSLPQQPHLNNCCIPLRRPTTEN